MARAGQPADPKAVVDDMDKNFKRIDGFYVRAMRRLIGREPDPPLGRVVQVDDSLQITSLGYVQAEVGLTDLNLNEWDEERYRALDRRITFNLEYYNELLAQLRTMSGSDREHIENRVETAEAQLCSDFRDMVSLDERVLQVHLPDHYWLERICGAGRPYQPLG